jgi:hypothetical protein
MKNSHMLLKHVAVRLAKHTGQAMNGDSHSCNAEAGAYKSLAWEIAEPL